jgi:putative transposase
LNPVDRPASLFDNPWIALRYLKTSPQIIRFAVMMRVRFPLAPRNVKDLMHEQGIEISQETVQFAPKYFGLLRSSVN